MGIVSFFQESTVVFNCFPRKNKKQEFQDKIDEIGKRYDIAVLPSYLNYEIQNLYPITDQVDKWNIFIVGNDKTYILAKVHDLQIPNSESLPNQRGSNVLSDELNEFFEPVWDQTLLGHHLQFFIIWRGTTYFVNSYCIRNESNKIIGATMFVRKYDLMPKSTVKISNGTRNNLIDRELGKLG